MRKPLLVLAVAAAASCLGSEVTQIGPRRPAQAENCQVQIVPGTPPAPLADVASVRARCNWTLGRDACFDELRRQACLLGGDTVYGLSESVSDGDNYIAGTVAWRGAVGSAEPAAGNGSTACTPICSPGFDCQAGRCVPLCNPACGPSEICNNHRNCELAPAAAPPGRPST
ncbi:MAG TPA: hypothetical protein VGP64_14135 [Polyangia bacterium]|jgi:hypothetical protein